MEPNLYFGSTVGNDATLDSGSEKHVVRERYQLPANTAKLFVEAHVIISVNCQVQ